MIIFFRFHHWRCWQCSDSTAGISWNRKWQTSRYYNQREYGAKKISGVNSNKSQGLDEIHSRLLKELSSVIAARLAELFQNSLVPGAVPNDWIEANIAALLKKVVKVQARIINL